MQEQEDLIASIRNRLWQSRDESYRAFQCALMPTVDRERVVGVRTPCLRQLAKELHGTEASEYFLAALPHLYYEENNLHAYLIGLIDDPDACFAALDAFLPHVDNWATCDSLRPACLRNSLDRLDRKIENWLNATHPYIVRFAIEARMLYFLGTQFRPEHHARIASIQSDKYYVNMMIAWYFATALAKQWDATIPYLREKILSPWVHRKVIQKAIESRVIDGEKKTLLRSLR